MRIFFKIQSKLSVQTTNRNFFLIDNHYITICKSVRNACTSYRVMVFESEAQGACPTAYGVWGKVMIFQVSVILFTGGLLREVLPNGGLLFELLPEGLGVWPEGLGV